jgi:hypothetical protein
MLVSSAPAMTPEEVEERLAKLETRITRVERRLFESQLLVARKLMELLAGMRKQQQDRDAQIHQALSGISELLGQLKSQIVPMVNPTTTH